MEAVLLSQLTIFLLIMARVGSALGLIPLFGDRNAPVLVKIGFTMMLSLVLTMTGKYSLTVDTSTFVALALALFNEVLNGLAMGFIVVAIINSIYIAGHMIDLNMGFGMAKVISPSGGGSQVAISAHLYFLLTSLIFVLTNTHHFVIKAFASSLDRVELGQMAINHFHTAGMASLMQESFIIGFQMAMPIVLTILISNIILGLLSKAMPGLNVFMVGMPFKIFIGLSTLIIVLPISLQLITHILTRIMDYLTQFITAM